LLIDVHLVLIPLLLCIAAIFAASEASLFSLSRAQLETLRESRPFVYRRIRKLIFEPEALLSSTIIGNECVNIMIGTFVTGLLEYHYTDLDDRLTILLSVLISSVLLLTFSEILPKVIAFRAPVLVAPTVVYPMTVAHILLTPFRKIFLGISSGILRLFSVHLKAPAPVSEKDFLTLVEVGAESGSLDRDEKEMIFNVFNFSDRTVTSVMTPWDRVFHLSDQNTLDQVVEAVKKKMFSRIPVVSMKDNRVVGILYTKELLKILLSEDKENNKATVKQAMFPPYIVSSHKQISKLFREFKLKKVHMALVVDEFGRQLGVVTLEDVLNALFQTRRKRSEVSS
jgi:putative hemolysin